MGQAALLPAPWQTVAVIGLVAAGLAVAGTREDGQRVAARLGGLLLFAGAAIMFLDIESYLWHGFIGLFS